MSGARRLSDKTRISTTSCTGLQGSYDGDMTRATPAPSIVQLQQAVIGHGATPVRPSMNLSIGPGLTAITGDEQRGKTTLLRTLAGDLPPLSGHVTPVDALYLDLQLPTLDQDTPEQVWQALQSRCPRWNAALQLELTKALGLQAHLGKRLFMLSTGSRRKVALVGLLASGATVTCLDQPYDALDLASARVLREFLQDMADHPSRAWVVADYEADPALPWRQVIGLS